MNLADVEIFFIPLVILTTRYPATNYRPTNWIAKFILKLHYFAVGTTFSDNIFLRPSNYPIFVYKQNIHSPIAIFIDNRDRRVAMRIPSLCFQKAVKIVIQHTANDFIIRSVKTRYIDPPIKIPVNKFKISIS